MMNSYQEKTVLIAGGTRGIGLATGIEFAKMGARVWLTHRWGSANETEILEKFAKEGAAYSPRIFQADISSEEDTSLLLQEMKKETDSVEALIISASSLLRVQSLDNYKKRSFLKTVEYNAWPIAAYPLEIHKVFGKFPRYIVGISSFSTISFNSHYDFAAAGKAALETLIKYLAGHLRPFGATVNLVRPPAVDTEALIAVFGKSRTELLKKYLVEGMMLKPEDVAKAIFGMCSGYFDKMSGQTITLDQGGGFFDNVMGTLERDEMRKILAAHFGLPSED